MLEIKSIKEATHFDVNRSAGKFFYKINGKSNPMTHDEQKHFIKTNIVIGYKGTDIALSTWANKQSKGLTVHNLPGETIEEKRQLLWAAVQENELERWIISLLDRVKQGDNVIIWYLSKYDQPVAELLERFVNWYITNN